MHLDLKKLKVFVAIAERGSMYEAAEQLGMTQSWVSAQLKQLEGSLDLSLVARGKGYFGGLSQNGVKLLPIAKRLLGECSAVDREIEALRRRAKGTVVIGVDPITLYIPERNQLIRRFLNDATGHNVELVSKAPGELFAGLNRGDFDLILASAPRPDPDIELLPLYEHELRLLIPRADTLGRMALMRGDMSKARILTLADDYDPMMSAWLKSALSSSHVNWVRCPETSFPALMHYAATMKIAALVPDFAAIMLDINSQMEMRPVRHADLTVRWGLMRRLGDRRNAADRFWRIASQSRVLMDLKRGPVAPRHPVHPVRVEEDFQPTKVSRMPPTPIQSANAAAITL